MSCKNANSTLRAGWIGRCCCALVPQQPRLLSAPPSCAAVPLSKTLIISRGSRISASFAAIRAAEPPLRQGGKIALLVQLKMPRPLILQKCANLNSVQFGTRSFLAWP